MKNISKSNRYDPDSCCGEDCEFYGKNPKEPCWGQVNVVDEIEIGDGDYKWIHECEGHDDCWEYGGSYKSFDPALLALDQ